MNGRPPVPVSLKVLRGNPGKRPVPQEPQPATWAQLPEPPDYLSADAKDEWRRISTELYRLGLLTIVDVHPFAAYCQAYARWVQAERAIAQMAKNDLLTGALMIKTSNGNAIQNPLVGTANKAASDMVRFANEFGLTPVARTRIAANRMAKPASKFDGLIAS